MKTQSNHPESMAWDEYIDLKEQSGILKVSTLGDKESDYYLKNRIRNAFNAGWKAAINHAKSTLEKL